jgi:hypothetical protein
MMQSNLSFLGNVLRLIATQAPVLIAALVGCVLVGNRWRALGSAAAPAMVGLLLYIFLHIASPILYTTMATSGVEAARVASWYMIISIVQSILGAVSLGLLILGIILNRNPQLPGGV